MQTDFEDEIEIDLKEVLFEVLAHWKMITLSTVLVASIAFLVSRFLLTPMYESTSQLFVLSRTASFTSVADIQTGTSLTNDYLVVAKDRPVVEQVIENLDLPENYAALSSRLVVSNPSDSRILKITVRDESGERAKWIADEMANVVSAYIAEKMDQEPPSIISWGYADGAPVSPNTFRNTLLGAAIGFLLAFGCVVLAFLLNDTIMLPEDIEKRLDIHVMGMLPIEEMEEDQARTPKRVKIRKNKSPEGKKSPAKQR